VAHPCLVRNPAHSSRTPFSGSEKKCKFLFQDTWQDIGASLGAMVIPEVASAPSLVRSVTEGYSVLGSLASTSRPEGKMAHCHSLVLLAVPCSSEVTQARPLRSSAPSSAHTVSASPGSAVPISEGNH
jgi:hypothetical protein